MVLAGSCRSALIRLAAVLAAAMVASGTVAPSARALDAVQGTQKVLVLGCRYADETAPSFLDQASSGIIRILDQLHLYFDVVSNARMDFEGEFVGWRDLPLNLAQAKDATGLKASDACQGVANQVLLARNQKVEDFRAVVMLFDIDGGWGSFTNQAMRGTDAQGHWVYLRMTGGQGGWTSMATWVHELGHSLGLDHSTYLVRQVGNEYADVQTPMSGFSHVSQEHWWFDQPYVCNGVTNHLTCITPGHEDQVPLDYAALELDQLGWLAPDQIVDHWGGFASYDLSAPTYNPAAEPTLERRKLIRVPIAGSNSYYAVEYRRGDDGAAANNGAFLRGWPFYELGLRSDRVTVYYVNPDWHDAVLGNAILLGVLDPGGSFSSSPDLPSLFVRFTSVPDAAHMHGLVNVSTPLPQGPETAISVPADTNGWYHGPVLVTLQPTSAATPVATTYYAVDDPGCTPGSRACATTGGGPVTVSGEGVHDLVAFSTDALGDAGPVVHASVSIDQTPPVTTALVTVSTAGAVVRLTASDARSGVEATEAAVDGVGFARYTAALTLTAPGPHVVRYRSIDVAGNVEATHRVKAVVPLVPLHVTAVATPSVLRHANVRPVRVHIAFRANEAPGIKARLIRVIRIGGRSRTSGWTVGTADVDGVLYATPGAIYRLTYAVTDALGRTARAVVSVRVRA